MIELDYELCFQTPSHVGTGTGFAGFLDSIVTRDGQGNIYLPGSTIKGKCRAAARRLAHAFEHKVCPVGEPCILARGEPCVICRIFGGPQFPGIVYFDNVELPQSYRNVLAELRQRDPASARQALTQLRTHIKLDRKRRSASTNHLFTNEMVKPGLPLQGKIVAQINGLKPLPDNMLDELALLWAALELITHLGRARSRGLGRCALVVTSAVHDGSEFQRADYLQRLHPDGASYLEAAL